MTKAEAQIVASKYKALGYPVKASQSPMGNVGWEILAKPANKGDTNDLFAWSEAELRILILGGQISCRNSWPAVDRSQDSEVFGEPRGGGLA